MNAELTKKKHDFEKYFFKIINNLVFGKTMTDVRKHKHIKLVITEKRRNYLVSEPDNHTTKFFFKNLIATGIKKKKIFLNEPVCLGLSILEISKIVMYKF